MTFADNALRGRDYDLTLAQFSICCFKCNTIIPKNTLIKRYDATTLVHETCPNTPHRTFAPHKYGDAK